jgi:predicted CoA-binding protein
LPIHPEAEMIHNTKCFKSVAELPSDIDSLLIMTPKSATDDIMKEAFKKGIRNIWVQQMSETQETLKIAEREKKEIITGKCIYMFTQPVSGLHKFHRSISKIFGLLPK